MPGKGEGKAMGHFQEGGAGELHGNGKEHEKIGHEEFLSSKKPAPSGAGLDSRNQRKIYFRMKITVSAIMRALTLLLFPVRRLIRV